MDDKNHTVKITLAVQKAGKVLWTDAATSPRKKSSIIMENGRSFFELENGEIRVYDRKGKRILSQMGKFLAVSIGGNYIAFNKLQADGGSGPSPVLILGVKTSEKYEVRIVEGSLVEAVADDGKLILVRTDPPTPSPSEYSMVDNHGREIWEKKQCQFLRVEKKGMWILWVKNNGKTVEYSEFKTGKTIMEMSMRKFTAFYNLPQNLRP